VIRRKCGGTNRRPDLLENSSCMVFVSFLVFPVRKQQTLARVEAAIGNIRHDGHGSLRDRYNAFEIQDGLRLPFDTVDLAVCQTTPHPGDSRRCCLVFGTR
jgi:hypothetical protein